MRQQNYNNRQWNYNNRQQNYTNQKDSRNTDRKAERLKLVKNGKQTEGKRKRNVSTKPEMWTKHISLSLPLNVYINPLKLSNAVPNTN